MPVELLSARVRALDRSEKLWRNEPRLQGAREPLLIEVQTAAPLGIAPISSYPLIVWNGRKLPRTQAVPGTLDRLQAYLLDWGEVEETNTVHVQWEGRESTTRTRSPITVRREEIDR